MIHGATRNTTLDELIGSPFKNYFTDSAHAEAAIRAVEDQQTATAPRFGRVLGNKFLW